MFKYIVLFAAIVVVATAKPGVIGITHSVVQPAVLTKTAYVDHSASSAITHQSFTNLERKVPVLGYAVAHQPAAIVYTAPQPLLKTTVLSPAVSYTSPH